MERQLKNFLPILSDGRFESIHLAFTNIKKTEKKIRVMQLINTSNEPVKVEIDELPAHLSLKVNPEILKPGQKGIVKGHRCHQKQWLGKCNRMVRVKINGGSG